MYLDHFGLREFPFSLTPNTRFLVAIPAYREAISVLHMALENGEGFIKVVGEVGTGKIRGDGDLVGRDADVEAFVVGACGRRGQERWQHHDAQANETTQAHQKPSRVVTTE